MGEEEASAENPSLKSSQSRESARGGKVCGVCGDQALGYNFNAITCESCKAFFRRNALRNKEFSCPFSNSCEITSVTRRFCQRCRLRKCFAIGMRKDWILSEEDKRLKREKVETNKATGRKRTHSSRTSSGEKGIPPPSPAVITSDSTSDSSQLSSTNTSSPATTSQQSKPQAWVTGTPKIKMPKADMMEDPIPSLPRSSPVSVITSQSSLFPQTPTNQATLPQSATLPSTQNSPSTSFETQAEIYSAALPSSSAVHQPHSQTDHSNGPFSPLVPLQHSPNAAISSSSVAAHPRSTPLLNSLIVNQSSEDPSSSLFPDSKAIDEEGVPSKIRKVAEDEAGEDNVPNLVPIKVEVNSSSSSSEWWSGSRSRDVLDPPLAHSSLGIGDSIGSAVSEKDESEEVGVNEMESAFGSIEKVADDTISQLAPITLNDDWNHHPGLSRRAPIAPDSIGSILSEAIKIEFEALGPLHCSIRGSLEGGCGSSSLLLRQLNEVERAKLNELVVANQALLAPLDADLSAPLDTSVCGGGEPVLLDIINLTAVAIRRLIKMSKRINAFKSLCQEDQVALLKGGCTEMMILRSVMTYDPDKDSWKIPHSGTSRSRGSPNLIKVDVLKKAPGNVYEEHQRFLRTFDTRWRSDESVMLLLSAITLFSPQRAHVVHADVVRLEQNSYYYLLRRYLENVCPNGCEARSTFLHLIQKMAELHRLNEEHVKVYLDVNPRDVEPLLIEIFDLKPH